jgi:hypothetical protein
LAACEWRILPKEIFQVIPVNGKGLWAGMDWREWIKDWGKI